MMNRRLNVWFAQAAVAILCVTRWKAEEELHDNQPEKSSAVATLPALAWTQNVCSVSRGTFTLRREVHLLHTKQTIYYFYIIL